MLADVMRRAAASGIVLPNEPGEPFMGGFFAGIIDTTRSNIIGSDAYQTGQRYALIVSPKSLESGPLAWRTSNANVWDAATRWDGLSVTRDVMTSSTFPAGHHCNSLPYPDDGASQWYLPALDELELLYRHFKPSADSNYTATGLSNTFPPSEDAWDTGENPSSDPQGAAYTSATPGQTSHTAFRAGGAEALPDALWTATFAWGAWGQLMSNGRQVAVNQITNHSYRARPVRRVVL